MQLTQIQSQEIKMNTLSKLAYTVIGAICLASAISTAYIFATVEPTAKTAQEEVKLMDFYKANVANQR